jgi:hypothetical protein
MRRLESPEDFLLRTQPDTYAPYRVHYLALRGFQAISIQRAHRPYQLAQFFPEPLDEVMLEDPRLSSDPDTGRNEKVVMWSYQSSRTA